MQAKNLSASAIITFLAAVSLCFSVNFPYLLTKSLVLAQSSQIQKPEAEQLLEKGEKQIQNHQFTNALQSLQLALGIYQKIQDSLGIFKSAKNLAFAYTELGDDNQATRYNQIALTVLREHRNNLLATEKITYLNEQEVSLLNSLSNNYNSLGDYTKAIQYGEQALTLARQFQTRKGEMESLRYLGSAYQEVAEYPQAINYIEQSLALARQLNHQEGIVEALQYLSDVYSFLQDGAKAISYSEKARKIAEQIPDPRFKFDALIHLSFNYSYFSQEEAEKGIEYGEQALVMARQQIGSHVEWEALMNLAMSYFELGDYVKMIDYSQQALISGRQVGNLDAQYQSLSAMHAAYFSLGNYFKGIEFLQQMLTLAQEKENLSQASEALLSLCAANLFVHDYTQSIKFCEQSLAIARQLDNLYYEASGLMNLGNAYAGLKDYAKATHYEQQALALTQKFQYLSTEFYVLESLGAIAHLQGNYSQAITYYQKSLAIQSPSVNADKYRILGHIGVAFAELGDFVEAEKALRASIQQIESQRLILGDHDTHQVSFFEPKVDIYRNLAKVLIAKNQPEAALEIAERGRARAFVDLLTKRLSSDQIPENTINSANISQIKQVARQQKATLVQYLILNKYSFIGNQEQKKELELLIWVIQPTGEVVFRQVDLKSLKTPLANLVEDTHEIMIGGRGIGNSLNFGAGDLVKLKDDAPSWNPWVVVKVDVPGQILALKQPDYPEGVTITRPITDVTAKVESNSSNHLRLHQLYQLLIHPIADLLPSDPNAQVIFIPQDKLFLVPFAALQDQKGQYLIEKHTIRTAPSIQVLHLTRQQWQERKRKKEGDVLVVGNPTMPKVAFVIGETLEPLSPLPAAEKEAQDIAQLLKTQALAGNQATKTAIVQRLPTARIIHLATHGLLDEQNGLGSAIALAASEEDNGMLTAQEILSMNLNAELVVLSACNTGRGRITGDGVIGLSRAFISAGVPSVLVSLWTVPDDSTASLMREFYLQWQDNPDKAQALRQAMLKTMKEAPQPQNWASFTLIGESQ